MAGIDFNVTTFNRFVRLQMDAPNTRSELQRFSDDSIQKIPCQNRQKV